MSSSTATADRVILVTGASGFIGGHLLQRLVSTGRRVRCLVREGSVEKISKLAGPAEIVGCDLANLQTVKHAFEGVSVVYHLAGLIDRSAAPEQFMKVNYEITAGLIRACREISRPMRFVFASSMAAGGPACVRAPLSENQPAHPVSEYGKSKLLAEELMSASQGPLAFTIVRPALVYGPGDRYLLPYFGAAARGRLPWYGPTRQLLNFIFVEDLVSAMIKASDTPAAVGQVYYLADETPISLEDIMRIFTDIFGKELKRASLGDRADPRDLDMKQEAWICSCAKARRELGFVPSLSLAEGFRLTAAWYRDNDWFK